MGHLPEFEKRKWYRFKIIGERGSIVGQCLNVKKKDGKIFFITFDTGKRIFKDSYGPMVHIMHPDDLKEAYEVSPRFIEIKTRRIGKGVKEEYWYTID